VLQCVAVCHSMLQCVAEDSWVVADLNCFAAAAEA